MNNAWLLAGAGLVLGIASAAHSASMSTSTAETVTVTPVRLGSCGTNFLTQSTSQAITAANSVSCNGGAPGFFHAENSYYRAYDMSAFPGGFDLCSVEIGIETALGAGGTQPLTLNVYSNTGGAFPAGTATLVATSALSVANQSATVVTQPLTGTIPAGAQMVLEVLTPNGQTAMHQFFIGSNAGGQTTGGFIRAPDCGIATPTALAGIGFPNMHMVLNANGSPTGASTIAYTVAPTTLTFNGAVGVPTAVQNANVAATAGNTAALSITSCTFNGANAADFSFNPAPMFPITVAAATNVDLPVRFTAGAAGARTASLDCVSNGTAPGANFSIALNGTGAANTLTATPAITFPVTLVGSPAAAQNVTATAGAGNTGNVTITSCAISGANAGDFSQTPAVSNAAVAPGATVNVAVGFTPTAGGARSATLTCNLTNGPAATFTTTLSGDGTVGVPTVTVTPATVVYGNVGLGQSVTQNTVLTNSGTGAANITAIAAATAPFALVTDGCTGQTLAAAGGNCTMSYSFSPLTAGPVTQTLAVTSNAGPLNIVLQGNGQNQRAVPGPGTIALIALLMSVFGVAVVRLRQI